MLGVLFFLVCSSIVGIIGGWLIHRSNHSRYNSFVFGVGVFLIILAITIGVISFVGGLVAYVDSLDANGRIIAAQKNLPALKMTAEKINEISVVKNIADGKMIGGLENMQQSTSASEALIQYRDGVIVYNKLISSRKVYKSIPLIGWFFVSLPDGVEMIDMEI